MKLMIADEAHDSWESYDIIDIKREGPTLAIVSAPLTLIISDFDKFSETVIDLVGSDDEEAKRS